MNKKINLERLLIVAAIVLGLVAIVYMFSGKRNQVTENPNEVSDSLRMELVKAKLAAQEADQCAVCEKRKWTFFISEIQF